MRSSNFLFFRKLHTHFRLPLEKIWGQGSVDFSKIPAVDSNYRKAAVVRLKKHSYLGVDKAKPVELLLLRALTARNQTAFECGSHRYVVKNLTSTPLLLTYKEKSLVTKLLKLLTLALHST